KVASVRCRAVRVESEHADGVARGEGNGGRDRIDPCDANAGGVESRYGCVAPSRSSIVRVIVRDVTDDGDSAVGQSAKGAGGVGRLSKRKARGRFWAAFAWRRTGTDRAFHVQQNEIGTREKW